MTSIGKENRSSQCLSYKEQQGRRRGGGEKNIRGEGVGRKAVGRTGLSCMGVVVWVYKIGLK